MTKLSVLPTHVIRLLMTLAVAIPAGAADLTEADRLAQTAYEEMRASNAEPARTVPAALAFTAALNLYEQAEAWDKVQEMNANVFWCKKRMNLDDLTGFVAKKHDPALNLVVAKMEEVADRVVPPSEADDYFTRAKAFASEHPQDFLAVTMRWFEVAERFPGTPVAIEAQKQSLAAQDAYMKAAERDLDAKVEQRVKQAIRETVFMRPPTGGSGKLAAVPSDEDVKKAQPQMRKLFKDEPRASKHQKRQLAVKMDTMAKATLDDDVLAYAMFSESLSLAAAGGDVALLIQVVDDCGQRFGKGYGRLETAQKYLAKMDQDIAGAVLTLLKDPLDKPANTKAGRYWCLIAEQWDLGLPMLANGDDERLLKIATMEIEAPDGAMQQAELGDAWYAVAKASSRPYKDPMLDRARHWYKKAQPGITGASKTRVADRLEELFALRPDPDADWGKLTEKQWDALKGAVVPVEAVRNQCDARMVLKPGQRVRVVPHPTDEWQGSTWLADGNGGKQPTYGWKGAEDGPVFGFSRQKKSFPPMAVICWVGDAKGDGGTRQVPGILTGPGKVWLANSQPDYAFGGHIRVKLVLLDDED